MGNPSVKSLLSEMKLTSTMPVIIDYISDYFIALDDEGLILFANKPLLTALGYSLEEIKYKNFLSMLIPEDLSRTVEAFEKSKETGSLKSFTNTYVCKDGSLLKMNWRQSFTIDSLTFGISESCD